MVKGNGFYFRQQEVHDAAVERYESLSAEEIAGELREAGIDPGPAIDAVARLVRARLSRWTREAAPLPRIPLNDGHIPM